MPTTMGQVVATLRRRIVRGEWAPGTRLPNRQELSRQLGASLATVQEAVERVAAEGFVRVGARKHGTFVTDRPPHLTHYRLIFPFAPGTSGEFWRALVTAAAEQSREDCGFSAFYGLAGHRDIAEYREVVEEVRTGRVAGLLFASSADELKGTPLLDQPGIPRVAVAVPGQLWGIPKVHPDYASFFAQAIDCLLAHGRRRIAVVFPDTTARGVEGGMRHDCHAALAARGLSLPCHWEQFASLAQPRGATHLLQLLLHAGLPDPPDGIILADDNYVTAAAEGIATAGVDVPRDLTVVAMANFPSRVPACVPVIRIGFDVPGLLALMVDRLQAVRRGETPPENTAVPAILDPTIATN